MALAQGSRTPRGSGLYEILDLILDKGLVIDAYVRVSLVGIEILTIDARVVVASVDTYLKFAEAANRLELGGGESQQSRGLPEVLGQMQEGGARSKTRGALSGAGQSMRNALSGGDDRQKADQHEDRGALGGLVDRARDAITPDDDDQQQEASAEQEQPRAQDGEETRDAPQERRPARERRGGS